MLLAALTTEQGQVFEVAIADEAGLVSVMTDWDDRSVPLVRRGNQWFTVLGVDLEREPGKHALELTLEYRDGSTRSRAAFVDVQAKNFPTKQLTVAPKYVELSAKNQARAAREREELNSIYATVTPEAFWVEPFTTPLPGVTGGRNFGQRRVFNKQPRSPHSGADLTASTGTPIRAANSGRVVVAKNLFFSGNAVFLDHGLGIYSVYLHLSEIQVDLGQRVERGEVLGLAGATGRVTGAHLHWGVRAQGARVDPFSLLALDAKSQ